MGSSQSLKDLDKNAESLGLELFEAGIKDVSINVGKPDWRFDIWKYIGFEVSGSKVMVPHNLCGSPMIYPYALLPMYDCVLYPVTSFSETFYRTNKEVIGKKNKIRDEKAFQREHGLSPKEMAYLAEKGRIVPIFSGPYAEYDEKTVRPLLEPGIPRLSRGVRLPLEQLVSTLVQAARGEDFEKYRALAKRDLHEFFGISDDAKRTIDVCGDCLASLYAQGLHGITKECDIHNLEFVCLMSSMRFSQILGAVLQTECKWTKEIIANWSGLPTGSSCEAIVKGLKINYRQDIPLEYYLDALDNKTTAAVRSLTQRLLKDPLAGKYSERLNAKIFEFNKQVEELSGSKAVKLFSVVSDIVVYGGSRFIESQSQKTIRIPKKGLRRVAEWIASKGVDVHARLTGKDWAIAQLCKARCKIDKCKVHE